MVGKCLPAILQVKNVIFVNGPDLAQAVKTSGSVDMLKDVFDQAKALGRAVIFIDEVDSICSYSGE
jgi:ATP-dependent 26S proteasome regulatory subunit